MCVIRCIHTRARTHARTHTRVNVGFLTLSPALTVFKHFFYIISAGFPARSQHLYLPTQWHVGDKTTAPSLCRTSGVLKRIWLYCIICKVTVTETCNFRRAFSLCNFLWKDVSVELLGATPLSTMKKAKCSVSSGDIYWVTGFTQVCVSPNLGTVVFRWGPHLPAACCCGTQI